MLIHFVEGWSIEACREAMDGWPIAAEIAVTDKTSMRLECNNLGAL
jgi:hypothetical protein